MSEPDESTKVPSNGHRTMTYVLDSAESTLTSVVGLHADVQQFLIEVAGVADASGAGVVACGVTLTGASNGVASVGDIDGIVAWLDDRARSAVRRCLVVVGADAAFGSLDALASRARSRTGVAVIVATPSCDADVVIAVGPGGTSVRFEKSHGASGAVTSSPAATTALFPEPLEIAILGPTEVRGGDGSLSGRPVLTELVVYLALHPEGSSTRSWSAALWPERLVPPQTIANRLSEARRLLGFGRDGLTRLRRIGDRHRIADATTDWNWFRTLSERPDDPGSWRDALALVRGRPFVDLAQGQWTVLEGFAGEIERVVVECALRLGERCLATGDPDSASWASQMALRCAPWDERLHRLLMRAADLAGNRSGVEQILRHLALVLEIDGDPLAAVHPQTAALYQRLAESPLDAWHA